jgi:hypothetical protein
MTRSIGGVLDMAAYALLAQRHRPTDRDQLCAEIRRLSAGGLKFRSRFVSRYPKSSKPSSNPFPHQQEPLMAKAKSSSPAAKRAAAFNPISVPNFRPHYSGVMNATSKTGSLAGDIAAAIPKARAPAKEGVRKSLYINK